MAFTIFAKRFSFAFEVESIAAESVSLALGMTSSNSRTGRRGADEF